MATDVIKTTDVPSTLLPPTITGPIFAQAVERSAVMRLARRVPLALDANTVIPVPLDIPLADWIGQAEKKPLATGGIGTKVMTGKKVAALIPVSEEVARTNPAGLYSQLKTDLPTAIARAFDHAVIHGKTMKGQTGPFADYLMGTSNSVQLGTATQANGGLYADLVEGMRLVTEGNYDFTGFIADQRLKPSLLLATDTTGRPLFLETPTTGIDAAGAGTLIGEPLAYSRAVSGKLIRQSTLADTGLRAIGGDFSQCAYGVGMDITMRISTEATYVDESGTVHSAFAENLALILIEAYFGFVCADVEAFVAYLGTVSAT